MVQSVERNTCDRCGPAVQAYWKIRVNAKDLFFCTHHKRKYDDKIKSSGWEIIPQFRDDKEMETLNW